MNGPFQQRQALYWAVFAKSALLTVTLLRPMFASLLTRNSRNILLEIKAA